MIDFRLAGSGVNYLLTESGYRRTGCNFDIFKFSYGKKVILLLHLVVMNIKKNVNALIPGLVAYIYKSTKRSDP
jgi:hypothetical protein